MSFWKSLVSVATAAAQGAGVRYDKETKVLSLSNLVLGYAANRISARSNGLTGSKVEVQVVDSTLKLTVTHKLTGIGKEVFLQGAALRLTHSEFLLVAQLSPQSAREGSLSVLRFAPWLLSELFALGALPDDSTRVWREDDCILAMGPLPQRSWILSLIRNSADLALEPVFSISPSAGWLLVDLSPLRTSFSSQDILAAVSAQFDSSSPNPPPAPAGAAPSRSSTQASPPELPDIATQGVFEDEDWGRLFRFDFPEDLPDGLVCSLRLLDADGDWIFGPEEMSDDDGDFLLASPVFQSSALFFIPFGALTGHLGGPVTLVIHLLAKQEDGGFQPVAKALLNAPFPEAPSWEPLIILRPLIDLCLALAAPGRNASDGERKKVCAFLTKELDLSKDQTSTLRGLLRNRPAKEAKQAASATLLSNLIDNPENIAKFAAGMVHAAGVSDPRRLDALGQALLAVGFMEDRVPAILNELGFESFDPYAILGVAYGSSRAEVTAAYHKLAAQYHPDRVTSLPREFQELAHTKLTAFNKAYSMLLQSLA